MIYIFFAPGFEEVEAIAPLDILRRAELEVRSVGIGGRVVSGAHGITVTCDISDAEADPEGLEMVVLPGGMPGTLNLEGSEVVQAFLDHARTGDLWTCAICAAPSILGHRGELEGKRATCYPGFETQLGGADYTGGAVERDGKVVTGRGPGVAVQFGLALVECLCGKEKADAVGAALQI